MARSGLVCVDRSISSRDALSRLLKIVGRMGLDRVVEVRGGGRWARVVLRLDNGTIAVEALADRGLLALSLSSDSVEVAELSLLARRMMRLILSTRRCRRLWILPAV